MVAGWKLVSSHTAPGVVFFDDTPQVQRSVDWSQNSPVEAAPSAEPPSTDAPSVPPPSVEPPPSADEHPATPKNVQAMATTRLAVRGMVFMTNPRPERPGGCARQTLFASRREFALEPGFLPSVQVRCSSSWHQPGLQERDRRAFDVAAFEDVDRLEQLVERVLPIGVALREPCRHAIRLGSGSAERSPRNRLDFGEGHQDAASGFYSLLESGTRCCLDLPHGIDVAWNESRARAVGDPRMYRIISVIAFGLCGCAGIVTQDTAGDAAADLGHDAGADLAPVVEAGETSSCTGDSITVGAYASALRADGAIVDLPTPGTATWSECDAAGAVASHVDTKFSLPLGSSPSALLQRAGLVPTRSETSRVVPTLSVHLFGLDAASWVPHLPPMDVPGTTAELVWLIPQDASAGCSDLSSVVITVRDHPEAIVTYVEATVITPPDAAPMRFAVVRGVAPGITLTLDATVPHGCTATPGIGALPQPLEAGVVVQSRFYVK